MRGFVYWGCVVMVALGGIGWITPWLAALLHIKSGVLSWLYIFPTFTTVLPSFLRFSVPGFLQTALILCIQLLLLRRVWILFANGQRNVPRSFDGLGLVLGYIGVASVLLFVAVMGLSIALKAGSGVPAGMMLLPAVFCIPWAFVITEIRDILKRAPQMGTTSEPIGMGGSKDNSAAAS